MKKLVAIGVAVLTSLAMVASAQAADETVLGTTKVKSLKGPLYKNKPVPVNFTIHAEVITPESSVFANPLKNVKLTFPKGVGFYPNNRKTPPCTDGMLSERSSLDDPKGVVDSCSKSVVGTGIATILIAKSRLAEVDDPILVIFNAGKNNKGQAKIKIYGYSAVTQVGILMHGTLVGRVLDVAVPVLSSDSATKFFTFNLPGTGLDRPELDIDVDGLDRKYVRATCPDGVFRTNSEFILGERTYPGGEPTTPDVFVKSPETTQNCKGIKGKTKLKVKVKGPKAVKKGRKGTFRVKIKNTGSVTSKRIKVRATGGGKARVGKIKPGKSRTVRVKTRVNGRKGSKKVLTFTAKGGDTGKDRIRVRVR